MQDNFDDNRQAYDEKMNKYDYKIDNLTALIKNMTHQNQDLNYCPGNTD